MLGSAVRSSPTTRAKTGRTAQISTAQGGAHTHTHTHRRALHVMDVRANICGCRHQKLWSQRNFLGHTPSTAGTFRKKFQKNSGKTPETLSELFLEAFPELSPPQYGWGGLFFQNWFRRGPLRAGHGIPSSTEGISDFQPQSDSALVVNSSQPCFFMRTLPATLPTHGVWENTWHETPHTWD